MPSLDTNVLVRFLFKGDRSESAAAVRLIRQWASSGRAIFVPVTVFLELEWVLRSRFGLAKPDVIHALSSLLSAKELSFESETAIELALGRYGKRSTEFPDCLHAALAAIAGHAPLWTLDRAAAQAEGVELLGT